MENQRKPERRNKGVLGAVVLIVIGVVALMEKTGMIERHVIVNWWPLVLIFIGGWILVGRLGRKDE